MAPDIAPAVRLKPRELPTSWSGRSLGLEVDSNLEIASLGPSVGKRLARSVRLEVLPPGSLRGEFPRHAPLVAEIMRGPGRPMMRVERDEELGYHVWAPHHGRHLVSLDGTSIRSSVAAPPDLRWERLLLAQPLPLAAVLQGLELFHASAVRLEAGIVAFVASSGTGKTSVAAHLVGGGASLVTDDVLALEPAPGGIVAHAGGKVLHLADAEMAAMTPNGAARLRLLEQRSDKLQAVARLSTEPGRLAAVYFLTRSAAFEQLAIGALTPPSPRLLLGSAFLSYLSLPSRMRRQLELCALLAESVRTFEVRIPADFGAANLAEAITLHVEREL